MRHARVHAVARRQTGTVATKNLITLAVAALLLVIALIFLLPHGGKAVGDPVALEQAAALRLQPVGSVEVKAAAGEPRTGEQVFQAQCSACHATGALGAPKFGDAAAWGPRIAKGFDALFESASKGKGNMPPQMGDTTGFEVARALVYMANKGGAHFDEPKAPEGAASAAQ